MYSATFDEEIQRILDGRHGKNNNKNTIKTKYEYIFVYLFLLIIHTSYYSWQIIQKFLLVKSYG